MKKIKLYTDGSCLGNPGVGGWAYVIKYKDKEKEGFGACKESTNNRMELQAVLEALKILKEPCEIELYSDSKLTVQSINLWLEGWVKKDFKGKANVDLWKEYLRLSKDHILIAKYVKAHDGHVENERCDYLARKAAKELSESKKTSKLDDFTQLYNELDYTFLNKDALIQALTHKSSKKKPNNERLEFLGDAVFDLVVGEKLYFEFPNSDEGELSKLRAALVSEKSLAKIARSIDLGTYIYMSMAEESNGGKDKASILSDVLEAILGAIFLESGFMEAKKASHRLINSCYKDMDLFLLLNDYKTRLQELTQARYAKTPIYEFISSKGPDHEKVFEMAVIIDGRELARGVASTKKEAEQNAAYLAYKILNKG